MPAAQIAGGARELREPGFVGIGHRQREQSPRGLGAHGGEIGKIDRESAMADGGRRGVTRKVHAFDERVGDHHQLARGGRHDHRAVVTDADAHIAALRAEAREVFADELEFAH